MAGLPKDDEWDLYNPYIDRSFVRNTFPFGLSNKVRMHMPALMLMAWMDDGCVVWQMHLYAPRTKYVEVFVVEDGSQTATYS